MSSAYKIQTYKTFIANFVLFPMTMLMSIIIEEVFGSYIFDSLQLCSGRSNTQTKGFETASQIETTTMSHRLNASNAIRGAYGMLHVDTADGNGQNPVVRTRTKRSTPFRLAYTLTNYLL